MEVIAWLVLTVIITILLFVILCNCTRIISFNGVEGLAAGYLSNLLWVIIISAGISAFIVSAVESVFGFLFNLVFNEVTGFIVAAIVILYFSLDRHQQMKNRLKELNKCDQFARMSIQFAKREGSEVHTGAYYFIDKNRIDEYNGMLVVPGIRIMFDDFSKKQDPAEFGYRVFTFILDKAPEEISYGFYGPKEDTMISMSSTGIKDYKGKKDEDGFKVLEKLCGGKDNYFVVDTGKFLEGDDDTEASRIYNFVTDKLSDCIYKYDSDKESSDKTNSNEPNKE